MNYEISIRAWGHGYSYIVDPLTRDEVGEFIHLETLDLNGDVIVPRKYAGCLRE